MSEFAAIEVSGAWLGRVRIVELENYGLRFKYIRELELWRLFTAQLFMSSSRTCCRTCFVCCWSAHLSSAVWVFSACLCSG